MFEINKRKTPFLGELWHFAGEEIEAEKATVFVYVHEAGQYQSWK